MRRSPSGRTLVAIVFFCLGLCLIATQHRISSPHHASAALAVYYVVVLVFLMVGLAYASRAATAASKKDLIQIGGICLALCAITAMHYAASLKAVFWHEIFQRAYYLPIVVAALWYGLQGGLLSASLASLVYLPHVILSWHGFPTYQFNQYAEIVLFFAFGTLTGVLSDQQRKQKARLQQTAQRLSEVYADLQKSFESLRRAERLSALGTLSAGLAHEIRNPLSAIQGALEIMGREDLEPLRRQEFTGIVTKEVARLNEMLAHFLRFARPQPPQRKPTAVRELMQEVHSLVSESAASRRVQVRLREADFPLTTVSVDPDQIKEVMLNLVLNATEAMPGGGAVELSAAREADSIAINIMDDGTGVPEGDLQKIFDPFYSTKPDGTGLGLPIAHQIMEQHGGRIEARRNPGRGMTFSLVFPLAAETESKVSR